MKSFPPLIFTITIKEVEEMQHRIKTKDAFRVVSVSVPLGKEVAQNFQEVPKLWRECAMNGTIQKLEERIITEWLPASGYEYANGPDVEVYLSPDPQNAQDEVWVPVKKKS